MKIFNSIVANFSNLLGAQGDTGGLDSNLNSFGTQLQALYDTIWPWLLSIGIIGIIVWGGVCGVKMALAHSNEKTQEAKKALKNLIIGVIIIAIIIAGGPLIVGGIAQWAGVSLTKF